MMIHDVIFGYNYYLLCLLLLQSFQIGINACAFRCGDGSCINTLEICNGQKDCTDGSDETRDVCAIRPCRNALGLEEILAQEGFGLGDDGMSFVSSFRCEYGGCISTNFKCNGISNCADDSDETAEVCKDTICSRNRFRCDYGACISRNDVCDNVKNCQDGSDERPENCKFRASIRRVVCPKRTKKYCDNRSECYARRKECDGKYDCADKSDEKAELCPSAVTTPPPTTTSTTAPTSPPVVFTDPAGPSIEFDCLPPNCRCPSSGLEHFCLPCGEIANLNTTCLNLGKESVCSVAKTTPSITIDVLSCGAQDLMTTASFSRRGARACSDHRAMVPTMTLVLVDCWGVFSTIMRCHSDGFWRAFGAQMSGSDDLNSDDYFKEKQPMKQLCQPYYVNSPVCGKRDRYMSTGQPIHLSWQHYLENRWPMVMGLKEKETYTCSATLISPLFLLTAGHCVIVSQDSKNQTIDVRDLKVQINEEIDLRVSEIILHPEYEPGLKPENDMALIKLETPIPFNSKLYPACVDLDGLQFLRTPSAVTFNRTSGVKEFRYDETPQKLDPRCYDRSSICSGLQIRDTQFCGATLEKNSYLVGGSSGGPYLQNFGSDDSEEWTVSGVVSFLEDQHTCQQRFTVFTATNVYGTWITDNVHNDI